MDLALAHHAERLAVGSVHADVQGEAASCGAPRKFETIERNRAVLAQYIPHSGSFIRDGLESLGSNLSGLGIEPFLCPADGGNVAAG